MIPGASTCNEHPLYHSYTKAHRQSVTKYILYFFPFKRQIRSSPAALLFEAPAQGEPAWTGCSPAPKCMPTEQNCTMLQQSCKWQVATEMYIDTVKLQTKLSKPRQHASIVDQHRRMHCSSQFSDKHQGKLKEWYFLIQQTGVGQWLPLFSQQQHRVECHA